MRDIIVGRMKSDLEKFGTAGTVLIGKQFVKMGQVTSLSNRIFLDVAKAHVVFICGKRGGGKSYTMGVIAEGMADLPTEIKENLSFIFLDTMGVYWTMKYPNKKDEDLLAQWELKAKPCDIVIYTPKEYYHKYKDKGIPTDKPFSVNPSDMDATDWHSTFEMDPNSPFAIHLERIIVAMKERMENFDLDDIIRAIQEDPHADQMTKDALANRFLATKGWGVFDKEGTPLKELAQAGQISILDVSCYATYPNGWRIKHMIVGLVAQKLFIERMIARKMEEYQEIHSTMSYFSTEQVRGKNEYPLVWLVIDEAHEFVPKAREDKNMATDPLVTIMREGRQPGISLILATQQPGKIHTDVMTQSDTVISHRLTARMDVEALGMLAQSYMREGIELALDELPRVMGAAVIFDDANEKMFPMRMRPRFTWHGGEAPMAIHKKKKEL